MLRQTARLIRQYSASQPKIASLYTFTDDELMLKESVAKFAKEQIGPKVKEMDEKELLDKSILQQLFDQGVMFFDPAYGY
jgi:short/branched chain acyl-CoA dehydrogenase